MISQLQCLWRSFIPMIQDTAGRGFEMLKKHHKPCSCDVINGHLYVVVPLAVLENYGIYLSDFIPLSCGLTKEKKNHAPEEDSKIIKYILAKLSL